MDSPVFPPGTLISAREREWVVLAGSTPEFLVARPLSGDSEFTAGLFPEEVSPATFPPPVLSEDFAEAGDNLAAGLLRTALRIGFTASTGPFRSLGSIAVEPRLYQLVPLLLALRMDVVRLLIADDVGIGKTIEAALIAKELLEQGEARRLAVLCSPALAEQWQAELGEKFGLEATLVLRSTITRIDRELRADESLFERHPVTVISTDFIKAERRRAQFVRECPDLVIVDEAHTCVGIGAGQQRQQRHELLRRIAEDATRHLILVTATPHSGNEDAFRDLIGLLSPELALLDLDNPSGRERLALHYVQRRRRDIRRYLDEETAFPRDRQVRDAGYQLNDAYAQLNRKILAFARETVADPSGGALRQRVRWWSALALLRSVASSPRAAAETLRTRSRTMLAQSAAEADELGRAGVLDLASDDALEGTDPAPGADDEELPGSLRGRLRALAREAAACEGTGADAKLATLITEVSALLADGYDPIVFCRFIPTADYVAEHLGRALGRKARVDAVTGTLPPPERIARIKSLTDEPGRHVLVATDCLSEGVNLQEHFQAVIHYDLAWNPTRHEQREGRVDRFGQRRTLVRAVTLYGVDNGIDGLVLDVLIRKHRMIAKQTGVAVPVPDRGDDVVKALVEGLLLRKEEPEQLTLDLGFEASREVLHREWESAAERESRLLTKYAWSGIKLDEVREAAGQARAALGTHADVAGFVRASLSALGATIEPNGNGFTAQVLGLPRGAKDTLGLPGSDAGELRFRWDLPAPPGEHVLLRTDRTVRDLARYVLETALDPALGGPARRCGAIRTGAVPTRTTLLLVRYRFQLTLPGRAEPRTMIAEDARLLAYRAAEPGREWLLEPEVTTLLLASPENMLPELARRAIERAIAEIGEIGPHLQATAAELADQQLDAHRRVRSAVGAVRRRLSVEPSGPPDVLGVYVYLPGGTR
jgi:superfamily II DNA or RNA helicase